MAKLEGWVAKLERWVAKLGGWVAKLVEMGGLVIVACFLVTTNSKMLNRRHNQTSG